MGLPWASAASKQNTDSDVGGTQKKVCEKESIIGTECPYNKRMPSAYINTNCHTKLCFPQPGNRLAIGR